MLRKLNTILREEVSEEGGDGGERTASGIFGMPPGAEKDPATLEEEEAGESTETDETGEQTTETQETQETEEELVAGGVDPNLALEVARLGIEQGKKGANPAQKPLTDKQINELLGVFTPDEALVDSLFGEAATPEGRLKALQQLVNATANYAIKTSGHTARFANDDIRKEFLPALQNARSNTERDFTSRIEKAYPGFGGRGEFLQNVMDQMRLEGYTSQNAEESAIAVIERATKLARTMDPQFDPTKGKSTPAKKGTEMVTMGGAGGGGGGSESSTESEENKKPLFANILGG